MWKPRVLVSETPSFKILTVFRFQASFEQCLISLCLLVHVLIGPVLASTIRLPALDVYLSKVNLNADVIVSLHIGDHMWYLGFEIDIVVELESDAVDVAISLFEVFDEVEYFVRFCLISAVGGGVVEVVVEELGVGVGFVGPFEGLTDEIVDFGPGAVVKGGGTSSVDGFVDDVPCYCFAGVSSDGGLYEGF